MSPRKFQLKNFIKIFLLKTFTKKNSFLPKATPTERFIILLYLFFSSLKLMMT